MPFFNISPTAVCITLLFVVLLIAYKPKGKFPIGCAVVCIAFVIFTVKTCRELDAEEAAEKAQSEEIRKRIEQERLQREVRKKMEMEAEKGTRAENAGDAENAEKRQP